MDACVVKANGRPVLRSPCRSRIGRW